jgi:hypothetical protein
MPRGYYKRLSGVVTATEFMQSITDVQDDPRFDTVRYGVNDCLEVEDVVISASDVEMFAALGIGAAYSNPNVKIAMIVTHPKVRALVQAYAKMSTYPLKFFDNVADAALWTGAPLDTLAVTPLGQ